MKFYNLGTVSWTDSQLVYHAFPRLGREGLILLTPDSPYVCVGYHQDVERDVDVDFCRKNGIPIFRREVGGGAVYLDSGQIFYQLIFHKDNPLLPGDRSAFYRKFLQPVIETYRQLGIPAEYKPVNDIIANARKISGNGAGDIGDFVVLVGNLILDFNYEMMARVLVVPDEKFRDKVYKTLRENLTTIKRELGHIPPREELVERLATNFGGLLGQLEKDALDDDVRRMVEQLKGDFLRDEWLYKKGMKRKAVKIAAGVEVKERAYKAPGGLLRATSVIKEGAIDSASISGDFFFYPKEKLESLEAALVGTRLEEVERRLEEFYQANEIESPGVMPYDLARVLTD